MIDELSKLIELPAEVIQFAKDGKYEEAWILSINDPLPSDEAIQEYLESESYDRLIVEYIWNPEEDSERYVLTVVQNSKCVVTDGHEFIEKCLDIFYSKETFRNTIRRLDEEVVGKDFLLRHPVQRVRLGIFNHWFSTGPIEMWDIGEVFDEDVVKDRIASRPEIQKTNLKYQGLAFIYNFDGTLPGPYHILKTPTCKKLGDEWEIDVDLVLKNMERMLQSNS